MVQVYHQSGIAGFHIEDQVMNKRCGHLKGKQLVDLAYVFCHHKQGQADK
jgi:2-methylisocitrate lyase-like PEP mutase family enzyme